MPNTFLDGTPLQPQPRLEQNWDDSGEAVLRGIADAATRMQTVYEEAGYHFKAKDHFYAPPTIFIPIALTAYSTLLAIYEPEDPENPQNPPAPKWHKAVVPIGTAVMAAASALINWEKFGEKMVNAFNFAGKCEHLADEINLYLEAIHRPHRGAFDMSFQKFSDRLAYLKENAPVLPRSLKEKLDEMNEAASDLESSTSVAAPVAAAPVQNRWVPMFTRTPVPQIVSTHEPEKVTLLAPNRPRA